MKIISCILIIPFVFLMTSCKKNTESSPFNFEKDEYVIKYDQSIKFSNLTDQHDIVLTNTNKHVGELTKQGHFIAKRIGSTKIKATKGNETIQTKIIVEPYVTSFNEPYTTFGVNKATIKNFENNRLEKEGLTGLVYKGNGYLLTEIFYIFYNNIYSASILLFNIKSESDFNDLITFYKERYNYTGSSENVLYFESQQSDYIIGIKNDIEYGYIAQYQPIKNPK